MIGDIWGATDKPKEPRKNAGVSNMSLIDQMLIIHQRIVCIHDAMEKMGREISNPVIFRQLGMAGGTFGAIVKLDEGYFADKPASTKRVLTAARYCNEVSLEEHLKHLRE